MPRALSRRAGARKRFDERHRSGERQSYLAVCTSPITKICWLRYCSIVTLTCGSLTYPAAKRRRISSSTARTVNPPTMTRPSSGKARVPSASTGKFAGQLRLVEHGDSEHVIRTNDVERERSSQQSAVLQCRQQEKNEHRFGLSADLEKFADARRERELRPLSHILVTALSGSFSKRLTRRRTGPSLGTLPARSTHDPSPRVAHDVRQRNEDFSRLVERTSIPGDATVGVCDAGSPWRRMRTLWHPSPTDGASE